MDKFVIRGGNPLVGTVRVSGAKNSALPCMAAAILTEEEVILENIPQVRDIETERKLLSSMGAEVELGYGRAQHRTTINCRVLSEPEARYEIVKTMRASSRASCRPCRDCPRRHARRMRHRRPPN
jgi:UDP-N-acetylglucosamine 1-carboxyvinyltransferase